MQQKICKCCGKQFEHGNALKLYCSSECYDKANRERARQKRKELPEVDRKCEFCGKKFTQRGHKQIYCSVECRKQMLKSNRYKPKKQKPKKPSTVREIAIEARKHGMSYGKYVALIEKGIKL